MLCSCRSGPDTPSGTAKIRPQDTHRRPALKVDRATEPVIISRRADAIDDSDAGAVQIRTKCDAALRIPLSHVPPGF